MGKFGLAHVPLWGESEKGSQDLPSGPVVKNLPCNAGDASSIPGRGTKIPHVSGQVSPPATTTEKFTHCNEEPNATTKTQHSQ